MITYLQAGAWDWIAGIYMSLMFIGYLSGLAAVSLKRFNQSTRSILG